MSEINIIIAEHTCDAMGKDCIFAIFSSEKSHGFH